MLARASPPDIWYKLHSKMQPIVENGKLSCAQLESIIYACQQHEKTVVNGGEVGGACVRALLCWSYRLGFVYWGSEWFIQRRLTRLTRLTGPMTTPIPTTTNHHHQASSSVTARAWARAGPSRG